MTASTRKAMGKEWKTGNSRLGAGFEEYYVEFKEQIDSELGLASKPKGK